MKDTFDTIFWFWLLVSVFGVAYPLVVGSFALVLVLTNRAFRPRVTEWLSLAVPAVVYYALTYMVEERQGFNVAQPMLWLTANAVLFLIVARWRMNTRLLYISALTGTALALASWWLVPNSTWSRLF